MARRRNTAEQIISKLRDELLDREVFCTLTVAQVCKALEVTEQTYYRWRTEYGGMQVAQARRLKQLEGENTRLQRAIADLTVANQILKEAADGNF